MKRELQDSQADDMEQLSQVEAKTADAADSQSFSLSQDISLSQPSLVKPSKTLALNFGCSHIADPLGMRIFLLLKLFIEPDA